MYTHVCTQSNSCTVVGTTDHSVTTSTHKIGRDITQIDIHSYPNFFVTFRTHRSTLPFDRYIHLRFLPPTTAPRPPLSHPLPLSPTLSSKIYCLLLPFSVRVKFFIKKLNYVHTHNTGHNITNCKLHRSSR